MWLVYLEYWYSLRASCAVKTPHPKKTPTIVFAKFLHLGAKHSSDWGMNSAVGRPGTRFWCDSAGTPDLSSALVQPWCWAALLKPKKWGIWRVQTCCQLFGSKSRALLLVALISSSEVFAEKISLKKPFFASVNWYALIQSTALPVPVPHGRQKGNKFLQAKARNPTLLQAKFNRRKCLSKT